MDGLDGWMDRSTCSCGPASQEVILSLLREFVDQRPRIRVIWWRFLRGSIRFWNRSYVFWTSRWLNLRFYLVHAPPCFFFSPLETKRFLCFADKIPFFEATWFATGLLESWGFGDSDLVALDRSQIPGILEGGVHSSRWPRWPVGWFSCWLQSLHYTVINIILYIYIYIFICVFINT